MDEFKPANLLHEAGITGVQAISPVTGGWSTTRIWRVTAGDDDYALRVFTPGERRLCRYEAAVMRLAKSQGLPVPSVRASGVSDAHPYLLIGWCPGQTAAAAVMKRPWSLRRVAASFGMTQARINQITLPDELNRIGPAWIDWPSPANPEIRDRILALNPAHGRLLHLDYHPLNVLIDAGRISAVLDWTNGHAGDPRADVARTLIILRFGGVDPAIAGWKRRAIETGRRVVISAYLRGYQQVAGPLADMEIFLAWAALATVHDLEPRVDLPGIPVQREDLDRLRDLARRWLRQASQDEPGDILSAGAAG